MTLAERQSDRRFPLAYQAGGAQVIAADGELDLGTVKEIERAAAGLEPGHGTIIIDLTGVAWITNRELAALCAALRRLHRRGASIALVGADPRTREVLDAVDLGGVVFRSTVREALGAVGRHAPARRAARRRPSPFSLLAAGRLVRLVSDSSPRPERRRHDGSS